MGLCTHWACPALTCRALPWHHLPCPAPPSPALPCPGVPTHLQVATRFCMVHVDTPADTCRQWNQERPAELAYCSEIFEDLAGRWAGGPGVQVVRPKLAGPMQGLGAWRGRGRSHRLVVG